MTKRKAIPARVMVSVAIRQANRSPEWGIRCPLCSHPLQSFEPRILEHMTPHATMLANGDDPDGIENLRWVHAECASKKTNGTKATTADGDIHKIAKSKRLAKARAEHEAVTARVMKREPGKIKSRGFDKTRTRRFDGKVVPRD